MSASNLVVVVTGSIAAYKGCEVISDLVRRGHRVRVVATPSALRFVGTATLEGLTGRPVLSDLFAAGAALEHIQLTRWADGVLVCPATANTLNRLASGLAGDLAGALFLAHDRTKPFLVAPAMNPQMWSHPATMASAAKLEAWGVKFIPVAAGRTACGEDGEGRMAEPPAIVAAVEAALARPARRLRVLVTSGGTAEPIDGVRVLTNLSTGSTGAAIADRGVRDGHEVLLLRARNSAASLAPCREEVFGSFLELDRSLATLLAGESFDAVIHAAAVGDFAIESIERGGAAGPVAGAKLGSAQAPTLRLKVQPKLLDQLRTRSRNPAVRIVAFKLTVGADEAAARRAVAALLTAARPDYVVHNDLGAREAATGKFPSDIYDAAGVLAERCPTRPELAAALLRLLAAPSPS